MQKIKKNKSFCISVQIILTTDDEEYSYEGIKSINIINWLLEEY